MAKIRAYFVEEAIVEDAARQPSFIFAKGSTHVLEEPSFNFWNARGKCVTVAEAQKAGVLSPEAKAPASSPAAKVETKAPAETGAPTSPTNPGVEDGAPADPSQADAAQDASRLPAPAAPSGAKKAGKKETGDAAADQNADAGRGSA